ncbi:hypothetical protein MKX01_015195, partial [Papaver californicum]
MNYEIDKCLKSWIDLGFYVVYGTRNLQAKNAMKGAQIYPRKLPSQERNAIHTLFDEKPERLYLFSTLHNITSSRRRAT